MQNLLQVNNHKIMPIYPSEILEYFFNDQNPNHLIQPNRQKKILFFFVDCRLDKKLITLPKSYQKIPFNLDNKTVIKKKKSP